MTDNAVETTATAQGPHPESAATGGRGAGVSLMATLAVSLGLLSDKAELAVSAAIGRIEKHLDPGAAVAGEIELAPAGSHRLPGRKESIEVFRLV